MKIFDGMQKFFSSLGTYVKNFSNLFWIFLGAFLIVSVIVIIITSFAYECKLTKTIDKINKFLERNPRINDDNLVAFNNMMKASSVPKTLRRQWQQFMLYREHPASYYMSFQHCVENPMRNSTYRQQMTVYRIISFVLVALSLVVSTFMAVHVSYAELVLQDIVIIPITILVLYWLISMVLDLVHSAVSGDLFQNYQYFEINMDKAMLTLPEFVDYEVLFSQDEIRRGIPVLFAYLQKRAIQEQQELEKARLKSVDHEKFDFNQAGLDGSLVLDRAMRETENYTTQRKQYLQEIERVNNEIAVLENNYREQTKEFQRQVQTSKETVENLKEQLEQATSTIEINYIKKQMRDELSRQQVSEKDFDILTDKHNQEIKTLNQEIKHYEEEIKKAKEAMELAMLSEFNTYSIKVYDNLEKIVDEKMQDRVDDYKDQIKGLEVELEEKNEELENVYTRYQEVLTQIPAETEENEEFVEELPIKKNKKNKKSSNDDYPVDDGMVQPEQIDQYEDWQTTEYNNDIQNNYDQYDTNQEYNQNPEDYIPVNDEMYDQSYESYDQPYDDNQVDNMYDEYTSSNEQDNYVPLDDNYDAEQGEYIPLDENYDAVQDNYIPLDNENSQEYVPTQDEYPEYIPTNSEQGEYVPLEDNYDNSQFEYVPLTDEQNENVSMEDEYNPQGNEYVPLNDYSQEGLENEEYVPLTDEQYLTEENDAYQDDYSNDYTKEDTSNDEQVDNVEDFDDSDFDVDFNKPLTASENFDEMDFDFDFGDNKNNTSTQVEQEVEEEVIDNDEFDLNKVLGLYDVESANNQEEKTGIDLNAEQSEDGSVEDDTPTELPAPVVKRKAGRPRKIVDEEDITPKRSVGRPRKVVDPEEIKPKRKAGRPRKVVEEVENSPKRKVGRPKKVEGVKLEEQSRRKPGRPRKNQSNDLKNKKEQIGLSVTQKSKRGRPRKTEQTIDTQPVKHRGRPRKTENKQSDIVKKSVGRPKKTQTLQTKSGVISSQGILDKPKRKAGRPRKVEEQVENTPKRKVGRPKKSAN
ncbi:MAG: hypothetical protein IJ458_04195 [Clostridia bacterium]|nr:hypothetical protein [Clostridia bacterium]